MQSQPQYQDDEIDLREIWQILMKGKMWIIATTIICVGLAFAYLQIATKEYKAEVYISPPEIQDITQLYQLNGLTGIPSTSKYGSLKEISPDTIFSKLMEYMGSRRYMRIFFDNNNIYELSQSKGKVEAVFENYFLPRIEISKNNTKKKIVVDKSVKISLELPSKENVAKLANKFVTTAQEHVVKNLSDTTNSMISFNIKRLDNHIKQKQEFAATKIKDRIIKLQNALDIAKKLNIEKPIDIVGVNAETPLYYSGVIALTKQIDILKSIKDMAYFDPEIRVLQEQLWSLKKINIKPELIKVAKIESLAYEPSAHIKPKKRLTLVISLAVGLMMGIILVFFKNILTKKEA